MPKTTHNRKSMHLQIGSTRLGGSIASITVETTENKGAKPDEYVVSIEMADGRKFKTDSSLKFNGVNAYVCTSLTAIDAEHPTEVIFDGHHVPISSPKQVMCDAAALVENNPEMREALKQVLMLALQQNLIKNVPPKK